MKKLSNKFTEGGAGSRRLVPILFILAILVFGVSGWAWWHYVRNNPTRTFYAALENNFKTYGFSKSSEFDNGLQQQSQEAAVSLESSPAVHSFTTISQTVGTAAEVKTESISTPDAEYVRYTSIETDQQSPSGETINFDNLLNIWGKADYSLPGQQGETFSQSVMGLLPVANFSNEQRQSLMNIIKERKVYDFDASEVSKRLQDGRPVYTYKVSISPASYIALVKEYGMITGNSQLATLDPAQYEGAQPVDIELSIDAWSQKITEINYRQAGAPEKFGGYGIRRDIDLPEDTIPVEELQAKLQEVQE